LTNQLARSLSEVNLRRVEKYQSIEKSTGRFAKKDFLYVCITGMPSMRKDEFDGLNLPGETITIYPECFEPGITEERAKERMHFT
jgi:hypothetical protein